MTSTSQWIRSGNIGIMTSSFQWIRSVDISIIVSPSHWIRSVDVDVVTSPSHWIRSVDMVCRNISIPLLWLLKYRPVFVNPGHRCMLQAPWCGTNSLSTLWVTGCRKRQSTCSAVCCAAPAVSRSSGARR